MFRRSLFCTLALITALGPAAPLAHADHRPEGPARYAARDPRQHELGFRYRQLNQQRSQLLQELDFCVAQRRWRRAQQVIGSLARVTAQLDRIEPQLPRPHREGGERRGRDW